MGSQLGPSFANAFLCFYEQIRLNDWSEDFKPVHYRRCVDDIFSLFRSPDHLEKFTNYLNSKHENIKITFEKESNNSLLFWIFWHQDQRTVLKHLYTTNQLLVGYILTSIVSFTANIKLARFLLCYLEHFHLPLAFLGFTRKPVV